MDHPKEFAIITPCFNENVTVIAFLSDLEKVLANLNNKFKVIVVDDSSTDHTLPLLKEFKFTAPNIELIILSLQFNSGHQGAIYQGLLYAQNLDCSNYIVMDSDGEDDPAAIAKLVDLSEFEIVNVVRGRRKESIGFRASYHIYRFIFKLITGKVLNFGNYCMISRRILIATTHTSFIHFAAHLSKQKIAPKHIVFDRRKRLDGKSKMNLTSLVHHAFKSFIEYAEDLLMIFLKLFAVIGIAFLALLGLVVYKKYFAHEAILGWASTVSLGLINVGVVCLGFFVIGILLLNILSRRENAKNGIYNVVN